MDPGKNVTLGSAGLATRRPRPFSDNGPAAIERRDRLRDLTDSSAWKQIALPAMQHRLEALQNRLLIGHFEDLQTLAAVQAEARVLRSLVTDAVSYWDGHYPANK